MTGLLRLRELFVLLLFYIIHYNFFGKVCLVCLSIHVMSIL